MQATIDRQKRTIGFPTWTLIGSIELLGEILEGIGDQVGMKEMYEYAVKEHSQQLGPDDPRTLELMYRLAQAYTRHAYVPYQANNKIEHKKAEQLLRRILASLIRTLTPEGPSITSTQHALATSLQYQENYEEAEREFREVLPQLEQISSVDVPSTLEVAYQIGVACHMQGKIEEAKLFYERAHKGRVRLHGPENPICLAIQDIYEVALEPDQRPILRIASTHLGRNMIPLSMQPSTASERTLGGYSMMSVGHIQMPEPAHLPPP